MRKRMFAAALPLVLASTLALAGTPLPDGPHVVVQGEGKVSVAPDSAIVTMVARHRAASTGEAKRAVDRAVDALLKAAPGFEVATDKLSATDLALRENIDYDDPPLPLAHVASREVKVKLNDVDKLVLLPNEATTDALSIATIVELKNGSKEDA